VPAEAASRRAAEARRLPARGPALAGAPGAPAAAPEPVSPRRRGIGRRGFSLDAADNTALPCCVRADQVAHEEAAGDVDPHFGPLWSIEPGGRIDDTASGASTAYSTPKP
jgi:hypothetical protein